MEGVASLIWIVLFLPLVGSLVQALFGGSVVAKLGPSKGKRVMGIAAVLPIAIAFGVGLFLTFQLAKQPVEARNHVVTLFDWINIASLRVPFELVIDPLSMTMVLIITGIGALIHLYATGYMAEDREYPRFFTYLNLFVASMLILVLGNNLGLMFIGWEGVGVCSYLLIGFWYKDLDNARAANKAFIVNRIGDWGLTLGMFLLFAVIVGNLDKLQLPPGENRWLSYDVILPNIGLIIESQPAICTAIALLFFVGACGKSAQFPLYFWLPDAMAGPTPVSALIHAATMVTSGIVILNRMHIIFEMSPVASAIVAMVGAFTALFAAVIAFGQTDIKKVLAYSTVSQLGFMFIGCGAGGYWSGMFHVTTHAFFKALLFLGAGAVIYAMAHNQDMRNYGNLRKYLPITFGTMFVGFIAIAGLAIPIGHGYGFAGFYSKEAILGYALSNEHAVIGDLMIGYYAGVIGLLVAGLTACYMTRMTWLTFFGKEERWRAIPAADHGHEHHDDHHGHDLAHHHAHDHGPDNHAFFYTDAELAAIPHEHEHHHDLDESHTPKEVPPSMWIPLVLLAIPSVIAGYLLMQPAETGGPPLLQSWLQPQPLQYAGELSMYPAPDSNISLLFLSVGAAFAGLLVGLLVYFKGLPKYEGWDLSKWASWRRAAADQFGYDRFLVKSTTEGGGEVAGAIWKYIDVGIIDRVVNGVGGLATRVGMAFAAFQTGYVRSYALMMLVGVAGFLGYLVYTMIRVGGGS